MIQEKLSKLKNLIESVDVNNLQLNTKIDSIDLISSRLSQRPKKTMTKKQYMAQSEKKEANFKKAINIRDKSDDLIIDLQLMKKIYTERCLDLKIDKNESSWSGFIKTFVSKNKMRGAMDLSGFNLGNRSQVVVNKYLLNKSCFCLNLSRNIIQIERIYNLEKCANLKELYLQNCGLHNEQLDILFEKLLKVPIMKLSLSSPDLKDRNNLTKYESLSKLIEKSKTLYSLQLSNIQIDPVNPIFDSCKLSSSLKKLDLSKNTGVKGICKNLQELDLSWNEIDQPNKLQTKDCRMKKLNLTGNPIPQYYFEQFLTVVAYPSIVELTLSHICLSHEVPILQNFIQKSHNMKKLELVSCQLTKASMKYIFYGIQNNKNLLTLNISKNKFPIHRQTTQIIQTALMKSHLVNLLMHECEITDETGALIFTGLRQWYQIKHIDISKNYLSHETSSRICDQLKNSCYTLMSIIMQQNMIKYDQLKQIYSYIGRNIFMSRIKIKAQFQQLKRQSTNRQILAGEMEENQLQLNNLLEQTNNLEQQYMTQLQLSRNNRIERVNNEIELLSQKEKTINETMEKLGKQLQEIEEKLFEEQDKV